VRVRTCAGRVVQPLLIWFHRLVGTLCSSQGYALSCIVLEATPNEPAQMHPENAPSYALRNGDVSYFPNRLVCRQFRNSPVHICHSNI